MQALFSLLSQQSPRLSNFFNYVSVKYFLIRLPQELSLLSGHEPSFVCYSGCVCFYILCILHVYTEQAGHTCVLMMMIAFIAFNSSLVPLIEGLCNSDPWDF